MRTIIDRLGHEIVINDNSYFVCATDKTMSGWGLAENKIAKRVIVCDTYRQAQRMANALRNAPQREGWRYVNICYNLPKYSERTHIVSWSRYEDFNNNTWMKYTNIPE